MTNQTVQITEKSKELFLDYAKDACNWNGTPLVGGNVGGEKEDRGNLTQLKIAGLVRTQNDEGDIWLFFTDTGKAYAREFGIEIED